MNPLRLQYLLWLMLFGLYTVLLPPQLKADDGSRLPIKFSLVQYLQKASGTENLHTDVGFTVEYQFNQRYDFGLAYRSFSANYYYNVRPGNTTGTMAERTIVYANYGCMDIHPFKHHNLYFRTALGMAGITEERMIPYYTTYNYTWVPTGLVGLVADIKAYRNVLVSTQCEFFILPYYKQKLVTNPPWVLQLGLGLTFE